MTITEKIPCGRPIENDNDGPRAGAREHPGVAQPRSPRHGAVEFSPPVSRRCSVAAATCQVTPRPPPGRPQATPRPPRGHLLPLWDLRRPVRPPGRPHKQNKPK
eukprot:87986-Prorocentrum_minimum.AAC.1